MSGLSRQHIEQLVTGSHWDPLAILGPHMSQQNGVPALVIRSFLPEAREAVVLAQTSDEAVRRLLAGHIQTKAWRKRLAARWFGTGLPR